MADFDLATLAGLPGVRKKTVKAAWAHTPAAFVRALAKHRAATGARDNGAINVWIDDKKQFRGSFCRYYSVVSDGTFKSKAALRRWLNEQWPRTERNAA